jgi:DnaJ-class molecular chaperone
MMICYLCKGRKKPICPICKGSGKGLDLHKDVGFLEGLIDTAMLKEPRRAPCELCDGSGHAPMECPKCHGLGVLD